MVNKTLLVGIYDGEEAEIIMKGDKRVMMDMIKKMLERIEEEVREERAN